MGIVSKTQQWYNQIKKIIQKRKNKHMNAFTFLFFMIYGVCIGSFLNVLIYRIPLGISVAKGRSMCPNCKHTLKAIDLIPIFSYLSLKGKCRYCKANISNRYAIVELLTGIIFGICGVNFGFSYYALIMCLFCSSLIVAAYIDFDKGYIPDRIHIFIFILAIATIFLKSETSLLDRILGTLIIPIIMLLISAITNGGIGMGDVKLFAVCGLLLGLKLTIPAFFGGYILALIALIPKIVKKELQKSQAVPMAPFFAMSLFIMALWGNELILWYISLL